MAETRETLRLVGAIRVRVADTVDAVTDDLIRSWAYSWSLIVDEWERVALELAALSDDGKWPSRPQVLRAQRVQAALEATYAGLQGLGEHAGVKIMAGIGPVVQAASGQTSVIASQLPPQAIDLRLGVNFSHADTEQIRAITIRAQEQVSKYLFGGPLDSFERIRSALVRGVALGNHPTVAARELVRHIEIGYNQSLGRALVVARTELLDAHRAAARIHENANADVLKGWRWTTALDVRTCPACLSMNGRVFDLDEPGPQGHQQCRCARTPVTKSWRELGFDIDEPASIQPDAEKWFNGLSPKTQQKILGPKRYTAWQAGDYPMDQWATLRHNPGWRPSYVVSQVS